MNTISGREAVEMAAMPRLLPFLNFPISVVG
jgi:hypothetical protein